MLGKIGYWLAYCAFVLLCGGLVGLFFNAIYGMAAR